MIDALRYAAPDPGAALRSLLGAVVVTAAALRWGSGPAAMWAFAASAIAGAVALQEAHAGRGRILVAVAGQLAAAVLLAELTTAHGWLFVAAVTASCLAAGMCWALGPNAGYVAAAAAAMLVLVPAGPLSLPAVLVAAAMTVLACLVQAVLIVTWPPARWKSEHDALARAYRALASDARSAANGATGTPAGNAAPITGSRGALVAGQLHTVGYHSASGYRGGHRLPERIAATLASLRARRHAGSPVADTLTAASVFLDSVADGSRGARRDAEHALIRFDTAVAVLVGPESVVAQHLSQQLHEVMTLFFGQLRGPGIGDSLRAGATAVRDQFSWPSPITRHALRLAGAAGAAAVLARFTDLMHGSWIVLTVLMVVRPETAHTYTRCAGRIAAFAAGTVIAGALTQVWQPTGLVAAAVAAVFVCLAYAMSGLGFLAVTAAVGAATAFAVGIAGPSPHGTVEDWVLAVLIGGALAVVAHVMLPDSALVRLRQRAGELLMTEVDYAAVVVTAAVHDIADPGDALAAAWQRAFRARAAFEAACGATPIDTPELRRWLRSYRTALNALTSACTALERSWAAMPVAALDPGFVAAVDDYVDALRGATPEPAMPAVPDTGDLAAADQHVRDVAAATDNRAVRVLVSELATITRSVSSIATDTRDVGPDRPADAGSAPR